MRQGSFPRVGRWFPPDPETGSPADVHGKARSWSAEVIASASVHGASIRDAGQITSSALGERMGRSPVSRVNRSFDEKVEVMRHTGKPTRSHGKHGAPSLVLLQKGLTRSWHSPGGRADANRTPIPPVYGADLTNEPRLRAYRSCDGHRRMAALKTRPTSESCRDAVPWAPLSDEVTC